VMGGDRRSGRELQRVSASEMFLFAEKEKKIH
jgi:hypothetical protein